jgi:hypothetical protein
VPELAVYHRVRVGAELGSGVAPVVLDGLYQANVAYLEQILVRLTGGDSVSADDAVQDLAVQLEDALDGPPIAAITVRLDQTNDLFV